jgi:hypothetical protein
MAAFGGRAGYRGPPQLPPAAVNGNTSTSNGTVGAGSATGAVPRRQAADIDIYAGDPGLGSGPRAGSKRPATAEANASSSSTITAAPLAPGGGAGFVSALQRAEADARKERRLGGGAGDGQFISHLLIK